MATFVFAFIVFELVFSNNLNMNCNSGFKCSKSDMCINTSMICDGNIDCPSGEDEPEHCSICFGFDYHLFGGPFDYFTYNTSTKSMTYKNSINGYYLTPDEFGYVISNSSQNIMKCYLNNKSSFTPHDCQYWTDSNNIKIDSVFVDIG
eukprot:306166_1